MKYSFYNIEIEKEGSTLLYNTLSGGMALIKDRDISINNEYLKNNGFIVNDDIDELTKYKYGYYSYLFSKEYINISIATTMNCNLRCPYCFEENNKSNEYLSEEVELSIIEFLKSKQDRKIHITWFGGEPLLNFKSIHNISAQLKTAKIQFSASIITNGTLFNPKIIEQLDDLNLTEIQITLDGTKSFHNMKRYFNNGKGTFDCILDNISFILQECNTPILIKSNLDRDNAETYPLLKEEITNKFNDYIKRGKLKLRENYVRNRTDFKGCKICFTEDEFTKYRRDVLKQTPQFYQFVGPCPLRVKGSLVIGPDGSIYKCLELLGDKAKAIGNINNHQISIQKQANYAFGNSPFDDAECVNCKILPICGGGCPIDRANPNRLIGCINPALKNGIKDHINQLYNILKNNQ